MDEGKSQEHVVKLTKALMKKLHDKGEVTVKGTKVLFKESAASNLEIKSLAKKIYQKLKSEGVNQVKLFAMDISNTTLDALGGKSKEVGNVEDYNNTHAFIYYNDFIDLVVAGPDKNTVEGFIGTLKKAFPQFEYSDFESTPSINWNPNGHTVLIRS